jgi:hypothetical protein
LAGETEVLGEDLLQCRFVHPKPHMLPDANPDPRGGKPATNRLSYERPYITTVKMIVFVYFNLIVFVYFNQQFG